MTAKPKRYRRLLAGGCLETPGECQVWLYAVQRMIEAGMLLDDVEQRRAVLFAAFTLFTEYEWDGDTALDDTVASIDRRLNAVLDPWLFPECYDDDT